jgi:hypothetical protein
MTWDDVIDTDADLDDYLTDRLQPLEERLEKVLARTAANIADTERKLAESEFERLVGENARLGSVIPGAEKFFMADAAKLFELRENALVVRNGETMPGDPLTPLTFQAWLHGKRGEWGFLFKKES